MKILIFSYKFHPDVGGIESISKMLAGYFFQQGHEIHLITKTKTDSASEFPFKVVRNPRLPGIIKELKWADLVFENNPCFSISYPNLFIRKPSVVSLQTWIESINGRLRTRDRLKYRMLGSASKVIACSNAIRSTFPAAGVIPNPYNAKLFKRNTTVEKAKDFVFLGRLVSDKGADIAIKALYNLVRNHFTASLTIVGDGEEMNALKHLVSKLNLQDCVHFAGILEGEDLVNCLNEHRFMLVPSVWKEPFGIVVLEGLACGCIPVISDGGGLPEAAGGIGLRFKRGSIQELAGCMKTLLLTPSPNGNHNALDRHLLSHTIAVIGKRYLDIFNGVVKMHEDRSVPSNG